MSATSDFYFARAEESARDASASKLDNVRDRCLRSEAAWRAMAEKMLKNEERRDRLAAEKAAADTQTASELAAGNVALAPQDT